MGCNWKIISRVINTFIFLFYFCFDTCSYSLEMSYPLHCFPDLSSDMLKRLAPGQWLNGELVLTGLKYVIYFFFYFLHSLFHIRYWCVPELLKTHSDHPPVHVMSNYFFPALM